MGGITPPLHFFVTDASGDSIVVEYVQGVLKVFDSPLGVVTNAPNYPIFDILLSNFPDFGQIRAFHQCQIKQIQ